MYYVPGRGDGSWVQGGGTGGGRGGQGGGRFRRGGRKTQTGDRGLSVTSCFKYIDKLDGQTMRCIEELCETLS